NLSVEEVEMIGVWKDKKDKKKAFMEELYSFASYSADRIKGLADQGKLIDAQQDYIVELLEFYRKHNKRPNRSTIHYILWKEKFQSSRQLASDWFSHLLSY
ncbi:hypothetical protein, partial [Gilliamella sp. CG35]|uniref:hypothetical protein n=1 Tax=Gilliamella sp. CG35 TaxID=3351507 RepID=UPI003985D90C